MKARSYFHAISYLVHISVGVVTGIFWISAEDVDLRFELTYALRYRSASFNCAADVKDAQFYDRKPDFYRSLYERKKVTPGVSLKMKKPGFCMRKGCSSSALASSTSVKAA